MKKLLPLLTAALILSQFANAQNNKNIGIGTSNPDPAAILDISSTDKGILIPRLTASQVAAINTPPEGLMVYNLDSACYFYYNNFKWVSLCHVGTASNGVHVVIVNAVADFELGGTLTQNTDIPLAGNKLTFSATGTGGNVGIGNSNPDASAILDMSNGNNKGMLVPKVSLSDTNVAAPVTSPATGLMVYNTSTQNNVMAGYYYWEGTKWMRIFATNQPVVSTVSVTAPIINTGTAKDPNIGITTGDLTSGGVISVTNGVNRLAGAGGTSLDVVGTQGALLYGTGTSSAFTAVGNSGEILQSNGSATPTWVNANSTIAKTDITGSPVVTVNNGAGQLVGTGNASIDVSGTQGGVMYGTGASSNFTNAGTNGQYLKSNGAAAPAWVSGSDLNGSSVISITNGNGKILSGGNASIDVSGPLGTVLYGTGGSSAFSVLGNPGELLQSNGAGAPSWVSPNAALTTSDLTGGTVVTVTNGTSRVVGAGGANVDITGAAGGVLYGTGASSNFTPVGTAGQYLRSNGAAAPAWTSGSSVTGSSVVNVTNGSNQVIGAANMTIDITGANGGVMYGTGSSSAFTPAGTAGQVLKSTGTGAPVWSSPNATLVTNNVTGSSVVNVTNGNGQVVGGTNMGIDVNGTAGGVLYGTGASSNFTAVGTSGQVLSSNGVAAPGWVNPNSILTTTSIVGSGPVSVTNGTAQTVGTGNPTITVSGTSGGVLYGTGASSNFTAAGSAGQILQSNVAGAPTWVNPNTTLTTKNITNAGNGVVTVSNGANQVVGASNATVDVAGTSGGVLYGTGASSNFTGAGTTGQILQSNAAGAPTWVNPNTTLTTKNITNAGNGVITVTNGTNQVVGASNATMDVVGTNGGVLYGTGVSSNFTAVGTSGQVLTSNGAGAPTWQNLPASGLATASNGLNAVGSDVRLGGTLTQNTTITHAGFSLSHSGGVVNVNDNSNFATNINTGTSTAAVSIANGTTAGTVQIGKSNTITASNSKVGINQISPNANLDVNGTVKITDGTQGNGKVLTSDASGNATWQTPAAGGITTASNGLNVVGSDVRLGGTLTQNTTVTHAGFSLSHAGGVMNLNDNSNFTTNINTGTSTGTVNIANGASAGTLQMGRSNTMTLSSLAAAINTTPTATERLTVSGTTMSGINASTSSGLYAVHGSGVSGIDAYLGYVGITPNVGGLTVTNPSGYYTSSNSGAGSFTAVTQGAATNPAIFGLSSVWHGVYGLTSVGTGTGVFGYNNSTSLLNGIAGITGSYNTGVYGVGVLGYGYGGTNIAPASTDMGVMGNVGTGAHAGVAGFFGTVAAIATANKAGVYGSSSSSTNYGVYANATGVTGAGIKTNGTQTALGAKSALVPTSKGYEKLYCVESPELWFEDIGRSKLVNGEVVIELDPLFLETVTIDAQHPMHVFLQEEGECEGLYVIPGTTSFTVKEKHHGTSDIAFSYRIEAKRRFYEEYRFGNEPQMGPEADWSQYRKFPAIPVEYNDAYKFFGLDKNIEPVKSGSAIPPSTSSVSK